MIYLMTKLRNDKYDSKSKINGKCGENVFSNFEQVPYNWKIAGRRSGEIVPEKLFKIQ